MVKELIGTGIGIGGITDIPVGKTQAGDSIGKSFGEFLSESLQKVNQLQQESDAAVKQIAGGVSGPSLQEAMVAVEKADVAFKLMMEVRQKILEAYKEISSMQA